MGNIGFPLSDASRVDDGELESIRLAISRLESLDAALAGFGREGIPAIFRDALQDAVGLLRPLASAEAPSQERPGALEAFDASQITTIETIFSKPDQCPILAEDVAADLLMNPRQFRVRLKITYGMTLLQSTNKSRINRAKYLLSDTELSLLEITDRCGFSNRQQFNDLFRKEIGMTPRRWRICWRT